MAEPEIIPPPDARRTKPEDPLDGYKPYVPAAVQEHTERRRSLLTYEHGLTPREARFVAAYLNHGDGKRAMLEAGFETGNKVLAAALLEKPHIAKLVEEQLDAVGDLYRVTHARIIAEHARLAFASVADLEDVLTQTGDSAIEAFNALPRATRAGVKKIKVTRRYEGKGDDKEPVDTLEIEMHDKQRSLDALARITKMNADADDDEDVVSAFSELLRAAAKKVGAA